MALRGVQRKCSITYRPLQEQYITPPITDVVHSPIAVGCSPSGRDATQWLYDISVHPIHILLRF